jgi:predicted dehydrogenase
MARTYRVAVIGRTNKGNYGHGLDEVWLRADNVEIVAVADEDEKGRAAAAARLKAKNAYADYRVMLEKEKPHIVSVAPRWLDCHHDMVLACARAGAHVFLEKPMCRTLLEADAMIRACEMHHVKLAIAHQTRYSPRIDRVKELLAAGTLGDILFLHGRGKEDTRGGGEDLMILGTHIMDLMRYLVGDAKECYAQVVHAGKPVAKADVREGSEGIGPLAGDHIDAQYRFAGNLVGTFGTRRLAHPKGTRLSRFGLRVYGTNGVLHLNTGTLPATFFLEDNSWSPGASKAAWQEITSAGVGKPETLKDASLTAGNVLIVRDLMEAIEKDRQPRGSMYDGRAALEMILAVYESHRLKRPVELPLANREHPLGLL